jgi:thiamine-phosphate pyrophosphorylase
MWAGANWIQYRCLSKNDIELVSEINEIAVICDDWGATLIITDHYHLLDRVDVQGVHLEDMQADFIAIREQIGNEKTLGGSANSLRDIKQIASSGVVDYVGCGPFSVTLTKPNDYEVLGFAGYKSIVSDLATAEIKMPVLAVGGITLSDVDELMETGIYGIAVCGAINKAENPKLAVREFYKKMY